MTLDRVKAESRAHTPEVAQDLLAAQRPLVGDGVDNVAQHVCLELDANARRHLDHQLLVVLELVCRANKIRKSVTRGVGGIRVCKDRAFNTATRAVAD